MKTPQTSEERSALNLYVVLKKTLNQVELSIPQLSFTINKNYQSSEKEIQHKRRGSLRNIKN